jgi:hypothetical protein
MGKVVCPRHGSVLACIHISMAMWRSDPIPQNFRIFLDAEGQKISSHLCDGCSRTLGLANEAVVDFEQGPDVEPVCQKCFTRGAK